MNITRIFLQQLNSQENRARYIEGGSDPTTNIILCERLENSDLTVCFLIGLKDCVCQKKV